MRHDAAAKRNLGSEGLVASGLVALSGQQTGDGDIFVQGFPMQTAAADANLFALLRGAVQEPGKPCQRHADDAAVAKIDPHAVRVEANPDWAVFTCVGSAEELIPCPLDAVFMVSTISVNSRRFRAS
jgi:hypothetical protein